MRYFDIGGLLLCWLSSVVLADDFQLTILHTNDVHSRVEQINKYGGTCSPSDVIAKQCYGGAARRHTAVKKIREEVKNAILLDAGDQYQGTFWFRAYKGSAVRKFMNLDQYDAMALGNHEFDNGPEGIIPFIREANFAIVSSNIDASKVADWPGVNKSTIVTRNGVKIGVIGYITPGTSWLSQPGKNITFSDIIESIQLEVSRLKSLGVKIIIALGHAGFITDLKVAREIAHVDIVVGGHTNTFLYTGKPPSNEKSEGKYPTVATRSDGSKVLVVQAYTYGKYLGRLNVVIDSKTGKVKSWSGNPVLLDSRYEEDVVVKEMVKNMSGPILAARQKRVGTSLVVLTGGKRECSQTECSMGSLFADALLSVSQKAVQEKWYPVDAAMWNAGGLRASINKQANESVTYEDILAVLPFGNTGDVALIEGKLLKRVFEWAVSRVDEKEGRFMQLSGMRMRYKPTNPVGHRITELTIRCLECSPPSYQPVDNNKVYKIATSSYILGGGDGYAMLKDVPRLEGLEDAEILRRYIEKMSPIGTVLEGRVGKSQDQTSECKNNDALRLTQMSNLGLMIILLAIHFLL